jgi:hypothetical protein
MAEQTPFTDLLLPTLVGYEAFRVPPVRASKAYRCPACANAIPPGEGHVVAWPDQRRDERRHLHHHCWRAASRRGRVD